MSIHSPSREEIDEVAVVLGIDGAHRAELFYHVELLATELNSAINRGIYPQEARRRTLAVITRVRNYLKRAIAAIDSEPERLLDFQFHIAVADDLGDILSLAGIRALISDEKWFSIDDRELELAQERSRDGGAEIIATELQRRIKMVVSGYPTRTLHGVLALIHASLERGLEHEAQYQGGRPKDHVREHALERLRVFHEGTLSQRATTAPSGSYTLLCEAIFTSLGLPTVGIEAATKAYIKGRRARR